MENDGGVVAFLDAGSDDGHISPEFDLPDLPSDQEENDLPPPSKRSKTSASTSTMSTRQPTVNDTLEEDEEMALRLLRRR